MRLAGGPVSLGMCSRGGLGRPFFNGVGGTGGLQKAASTKMTADKFSSEISRAGFFRIQNRVSFGILSDRFGGGSGLKRASIRGSFGR